MIKILNEQERSKLKDHWKFSESYVVKFWIKDGEFWRQKEVECFSTDKGAGKFVEERFNKDFKNQEVKIVSIIYQ